MKRIISVIMTALIILGVPGCWDIQELNEIGLVLLIGIDNDPKGDGFEVTVHVQTPLPSGTQEEGGSGGKQNVWIASSRGQTIMDAYRNLRGRAGFRLSFHHARLIVIGEDLARKGIKPVLDHMLRTREIRLNSMLLICQGPAKEFLQIKPELSESLHDEVQGLLQNEDVWSKSHSVQLLEFVQDLLDPGVQPVAARLFSIKPENPPQAPGGESTEVVKEVAVAQGLAVFNDDQLVGWLTGTETIGFRYITSVGGEMIMVIPWHNARVSLQVRMISCNKTASFKAGRPTFKINIFVTGIIVEYAGYIDLADGEIIKELERLAGDQLANILSSTDQKAKELGVDFLDYGGILSRNQPKQWTELNKKWRETFPTVDTVFDIRVSLVHPGVIVEPLP